MALGRTHDLMNLSVLPAFLYFLPKETMVPFTVGYIAGTFLLSPDLDTPSSKPSRRWGPLRWFWMPYQLLSSHRGVSHLPLLGTVIRIAYAVFGVLFLYFTLIGVVSTLDKGLGLLISGWNPFEDLERLFTSEEALLFVAGLICADTVHIALDRLVSFLKRIT